MVGNGPWSCGVRCSIALFTALCLLVTSASGCVNTRVVHQASLDSGTSVWPTSEDQYHKVVSRLVERGHFSPIFDKDGVLILKKRDAP